MIEVIVNYNSDELTIKNPAYKKDFIFHKLYNPIETLKILEEVLNQLSEDRGIVGWKLTKIDEDTSTTVGEW